METRKPRRKDGILSRQLGDEWVLYDSDGGTVHIVNPMAEFVWNLCDGAHDLASMEQQIQDSYDIPKGTDVRKDLEAIIQNFDELGIIDYLDA